MKLTKNFNKSEFDCRCGCDMPKKVLSNIINLAVELQTVRDVSNESIIVNSGYRCKSHNKAIGGVKNSQHVLGKAADIVMLNNRPTEVINLVEHMLEDENLFPFHIGGIGSYNTFTHLDIRADKARW